MGWGTRQVLRLVLANDTLLDMDTFQKTDCTFCERLVLGSSDAPWDTAIGETDRYVIVPTKGSLVSGWLLVVSKQHALCSGELRSDEFGDLEEAIDLARKIVERHFGEATIFEHGPSASGTSLGCGIDHLHFHVVPLSFSLVKAVDSVAQNAVWKELGDLRNLAGLHRSGVGYAVVGEPGSPLVWFQPPATIRQPLRRAIANQLGIPGCFDYATHPHLNNVLRTLDQVAVGV